MAEPFAGMTHWYRPRQPADASELLSILREQPWNAIRAKMHGEAVTADFALSPRGERLCLISGDQADRVAKLANAVHILPRREWQRSHSEVLVGDLSKGRRSGLALMPPDNDDLISYLDFVPPADDEIDVGFGITHPDWRGRGLVIRLVAILVLRYFDMRFVASTAESNRPVRRLLPRFGFHLDRRVPNDRVNGETTLIFVRPRAAPFDLTPSAGQR